MQFAQTEYNRAKSCSIPALFPQHTRPVPDRPRYRLGTIKNLEQQLSAQQVQLQYYKVVALADGIIGDVPSGGDRVTTMTCSRHGPRQPRLYVNVPVERSKDLRMGQRVELLDTGGKTVAESRIDFISPQVSSDTQAILAKATFDNSSATLRTSQFARARVIWGVRQGAMLPVLSVARINGQFFVWAVENAGGKRSPPAAGARRRLIGNDIPSSTVKAADHVIVVGAPRTFDGAPSW